MTLGEYVKDYRAEHGLTMRAFARLAELSPTYICYLESGRNSNGSVPSPSIETYKIIAKATGTTLEDLLRSIEDNVVINQTFSIEEQEIILLYRKASKRDRQLIMDILKEYEI